MEAVPCYCCCCCRFFFCWTLPALTRIASGGTRATTRGTIPSTGHGRLGPGLAARTPPSPAQAAASAASMPSCAKFSAKRRAGQLPAPPATPAASLLAPDASVGVAVSTWRHLAAAGAGHAPAFEGPRPVPKVLQSVKVYARGALASACAPFAERRHGHHQELAHTAACVLQPLPLTSPSNRSCPRGLVALALL